MGINVVEFQNDLDRFEDALADEIVEAKRLLAAEVLKGVVAKSPVLTGTYISNHKVMQGEEVDAFIMWLPHTPGERSPSARASKKASLAPEVILRGEMVLQGIKFAAGKVSVGNPVPYGPDIERGSSGYAPMAPYETTHNHVEINGDAILSRVRERVI